MSEKTGRIYCIFHWETEKCYIGKESGKLWNRRNSHLSGKGSKALREDIKKYGVKAFMCILLMDGIPAESLDTWEIFFIDWYDTFRNGYNRTKGGDGIDSETDRQIQTRPEVQTKRRASILVAVNKPGVKEKQKAALRQAWSRTEVRSNHITACNRPGWRRQHRAICTEANRQEDKRSKYRKANFQMVRLAFALRELGRSYAKIAEDLGISWATVRHILLGCYGYDKLIG